MNSPLKQLLLRWLVLALGVMLATKLVPGIACDDGATLVVVVVLLSFFNAILKPLLVLFTLPFIVVTMGLGIIVINALLFLLVGRLVAGFHVESFWSAVGGSLVVSITNLAVSSLTKGSKTDRKSPPPPPPPAPGPKPKPDDVIDI
ncbi:MAG: phage holin family protein [Opitutaceae bacterium]|nr:phage holin family protein [Opitutaceae bacterium]